MTTQVKCTADSAVCGETDHKQIPHQLELPDPGLSQRLDDHFKHASERFRAPARIDQARIDRGDSVLLNWLLEEAQRQRDEQEHEARREKLPTDLAERFGSGEKGSE